jgi:uncharacterized membrane protein YjdF
MEFELLKAVPHYDKIIHFVSGMLLVVFAWCIIVFFKADRVSKSFQTIFIICFCMAIAVMWEFFEFTCDHLFGMDMQRVTSSGVNDTMFDLLATTVGALIGTAILMRFQSAFEKFFTTSAKK